MKPQTEVKHTPTPWKVTHQIATDGTNDIVADGKFIAHLGGNLNGDSEHEANAEFIVLAVNSHEALLKALKSALTMIRSISRDTEYGALKENTAWKAKQLETIIAQVEGGSK